MGANLILNHASLVRLNVQIADRTNRINSDLQVHKKESRAWSDFKNDGRFVTSFGAEDDYVRQIDSVVRKSG